MTNAKYTFSIPVHNLYYRCCVLGAWFQEITRELSPALWKAQVQGRICKFWLFKHHPLAVRRICRDTKGQRVEAFPKGNSRHKLEENLRLSKFKTEEQSLVKWGNLPHFDPLYHPLWRKKSWSSPTLRRNTAYFSMFWQSYRHGIYFILILDVSWLPRRPIK